MSVTLFCPNLKCRCILQVPDRARGKKVRCATCQTTFFVPRKEAVSTAAKKASAPPADNK